MISQSGHFCEKPLFKGVLWASYDNVRIYIKYMKENDCFSHNFHLE